MKSKFVIDTGVLTLFYAGEARVKPYFDQIHNGKAEGLMMSVNLSEHFYKTCQKLGRQTANLRYYQSRTILTIAETSEELALTAGTEKCRRSTLSLADCFALALAKSVKGTLLTTDSELGKVKDVDVKLFKVDY